MLNYSFYDIINTKATKTKETIRRQSPLPFLYAVVRKKKNILRRQLLFKAIFYFVEITSKTVGCDRVEEYNFESVNVTAVNNMETGGSDGESFDDEIDDAKHERILENVLNLNKVQHLKKPSRTEPALQISEFNLVKSVAGKGSTVALDHLTKALKKRKKLGEAAKKIESVRKKGRTLPKPLEKPQRERIKRSVGYEKSRLELDRWEGFVAANRSLAHQVFPLGSVEKTKIVEKESANFPQTWRIKSEIQKELEKLEPRVEITRVDEEDRKEFTLTLEELKERRKEIAKLRAHQSFKESKARRQNKIKSKKYHRILRREKIRKKLKEFEELQKINPEQALSKLEEIERARALERYSLRHKGTGQWAKSKQFRAKYDKESRQVLAQQLAISRDLTQKLNAGSGSDDEIADVDDNLPENDKDNPWIGAPKPDKEVAEFYSSYKKYWSGKLGKRDERGGAEPTGKANVDYKNGNEVNGSVGSSKTSPQRERIKKTPKAKKEEASLNSSSGDWDIEELFQRAEDALEQKLTNKMKSMKKKTKLAAPKPAKRAKLKTKFTKTDLSMPTQSKRHAIDEEMLESAGNLKENPTESVDRLKKVLEGAGADDIVVPDSFPRAIRTATVLDSAKPDLVTEDDNREDSNQDQVIIEAFEDDDIDADFGKEKAEEIDKDNPKDIDLNLPGWGSWAGAMIDPNKQRKRKRFIFKMPANMPRRDGNRGNLIINEKAETKIRSHLVSEVPFPFKTVKDFEASIRAPIGNTFVPETAFRKLIRPAVETRMGAIITPVTKDVLTGKKKKK